MALIDSVHKPLFLIRIVLCSKMILSDLQSRVVWFGQIETILFFSTTQFVNVGKKLKCPLTVYSFNNIFKVPLGLEYSKCNGPRAFHSNETRYSKAIYKLLLDYDKMQENSSSTLLKCSVFTFAFLSRLSIEKASVMTSQPFIAILTPARDQNISDKNVKVADFLPSIVTDTSFGISMISHAASMGDLLGSYMYWFLPKINGL